MSTWWPRRRIAALIAWHVAIRAAYLVAPNGCGSSHPAWRLVRRMADAWIPWYLAQI